MYKYSPLRSAFFENYLLRATQRVALNDPFEILPARRWMEQAYREHYQKDYSGSWPNLLSHITKINLNNFGVISMASRHDNILMWSHYADEHRGMVVEIDEKNELLRQRFGIKEDADLTHDVVYRNDRVNEFDSNHIFLPYIQKALEWSYEEEKRIIVPNLHKSDCWMCAFGSEAEAQTAYTDKTVDGIKLISCQISGKVVRFLASDIEQPFNPFDIVNNPRFMSMFRVPPAAIKSVIFGVNASKESVERVRKVIELNSELRHVKISMAVLSESRFGIECVRENA